MLRELTERLICPTCRDATSVLHAHAFLEGEQAHIRDGVLICHACREWYPISDYILELVPPDLLYLDDLAIFQQRFANNLKAIGCKPHEITATGRSSVNEDLRLDQRKQRAHFDRYAEGVEPDFKDYTHSIFIRAASARFIDIWKGRLRGSKGWLLDIGCGTGNNSFPLADTHVVAAFDISKKIIRRDTEWARNNGLMGSTTFFVGDGGFLSFKDQSFDFAQTFGALHHLPNPEQAVKDIIRILKPGGIYFGVENNKTSLRWIFDLMMKIMPLWVEEAGAAPLISENMLKGWAAGLPVDIHCETSVFLPPHLFNLFSFHAARAVLDCSDRVCGKVPWLRTNGGQIVYHLSKTKRI
jgi:SAM-dependent methyltransferase/uncharacterized protein YbaR (Trm112 family)